MRVPEIMEWTLDEVRGLVANSSGKHSWEARQLYKGLVNCRGKGMGEGGAEHTAQEREQRAYGPLHRRG